MKKYLFLLIFIFLCIPSIFAQTSSANKIEDEYNGLKWESSPQDLLKLYPDAYRSGTNDSGDELYYLDANGATRIFFFGNGKFYNGRIVYEDVTSEKALALMKKVVNTYGKFDDEKEGSQNGNKYITFILEYSWDISIYFQLIDVYNDYGYQVSNVVIIDFTNSALKSKISAERVQKMQDDLEL